MAGQDRLDRGVDVSRNVGRHVEAAVAGLQKVKTVTGDVSDEKTIAGICTPDTDAVFHLAAVVSGAAEADILDRWVSEVMADSPASLGQAVLKAMAA